MIELQSLRVQHQAARIRGRSAVPRITHHGGANRGQVHTDLVLSSGHRPRLDEQLIGPTLDHSDPSERLDPGLIDPNPAIGGDEDLRVDLELGRPVDRRLRDQGHVRLAHLAPRETPGQRRVRL